MIINLFKNAWNLKVHIYFSIANALNTTWIVVFNQGTKVSVVIASFILISWTVFIFLTWFEIGNIPKEKVDKWTYIVRNIFAFYLGWNIF